MAERPEEVRAAGAVVWREGAGGTEVALVHRPKYDDWTIPKGKCEPGEHVLLTAVREVAEETGHQVTLGRRLSPSFYDVEGRPKRVDYWAGQCADPDAVFVPGPETDAMTWLRVPDAARVLTYCRDVAVLEEFASGPPATVPLVLLRHASAGRRSGWGGADLARPLDARGAGDADRLAWLLRCFGVGRVVTSAAERCVATIRPFAALTGSTIEIEPLFTVGAQVAPQNTALRAAALAAGEQPAVLCAHRENLPLLLAAACARLDTQPPPGPALRKARFWVLHVAAGAVLASAERHDPAPG